MSTDVRVTARVRALRPSEAAWVALAPCALVTFAALMLIGPAIGHLLFEPPAGEALWPPNIPSTEGQAEPVKRGRFVVALLGPVLLAGAVLMSARRPLRVDRRATRVLVLGGQLGLLAFVVAAMLGQNNRLLASAEPLWPVFGVPSLIIAGLIALALPAALRSHAVMSWAREVSRERRWLRAACLAPAVAVPVMWLLTAIVTERTVGDLELMWWTLSDPSAILDGRTPLVDYYAFYAQLTPYYAAVTLRTFGESFLTYAIAMTTLSLLAMLAMYALLRRVLGGRSLLALALYAPFAATGFLTTQTGTEPVEGALGNAILFAVWPMRYGGAYVVAWLLARHLDGAAPRRTWLLFLTAGLVAIDNLEFGAAAFTATVVAVLCARPAWSREALARFAGQVLAGLLAAVACVVLLTLLRAGSLPRPELLLEWPRVFGVLGLFAQPMPKLGFHLAIYVTYAAALVVAAVRRATGEARSLMTGMLAWSGTFGLLSASYYLGRSDTLKLGALLSAWALAVVLLTIVVVQRLAASTTARPSPAVLLVLFGFGLAVSCLHDMPAPWRQIERLRAAQPPPTYQPASRAFVAAHTEPGERVTILMPLGHRVARQLDLVNVSPYPFIEAIVTRRQFDMTIRVARREGARKLFMPAPMVGRPIAGFAHADALMEAGFRQVASDPLFTEWVDG